MALQIDTSDGGSHNSWYDNDETKEDAVILKRFDDMFHEQLVTENHDKFVLPLKRLSVLGKGSSSTVYKSIYYPTMTIVAEKVVVIGDTQKRIQLCREVELLKSMLCGDESEESEGSRALVQLIACFANPVEHTVSLCLEFMNSGSLEDILKDTTSRSIGLSLSAPHGHSNYLDETVLHGIATQVLTSLAYLHRHRVIHRDLKPGNILINNKGLVKISDFGLSRALQLGCSVTQSFIGTYQYMAPERITGGEYSLSSDVWAAGMTLHTLAIGRYPYDSSIRRDVGGDDDCGDISQVVPSVKPSTAGTARQDMVEGRKKTANPTATTPAASVRRMGVDRRQSVQSMHKRVQDQEQDQRYSRQDSRKNRSAEVAQIKKSVDPGAAPNIAIDYGDKSVKNSTDYHMDIDVESNNHSGPNYWSIMHSIVEKPVPRLPADHFSTNFCDFITAMCHKDPTHRLSCAELLQHPFIVGANPVHVSVGGVAATQVVEFGSPHSPVQAGSGPSSPVMSPSMLTLKPSQEVTVNQHGHTRGASTQPGRELDNNVCRDSNQSISVAASWLLRNSTQFLRNSQIGGLGMASAVAAAASTAKPNAKAKAKAKAAVSAVESKSHTSSNQKHQCSEPVLAKFDSRRGGPSITSVTAVESTKMMRTNGCRRVDFAVDYGPKAVTAMPAKTPNTKSVGSSNDNRRLRRASPANAVSTGGGETNTPMRVQKQNSGLTRTTPNPVRSKTYINGKSGPPADSGNSLLSTPGSGVTTSENTPGTGSSSTSNVRTPNIHKSYQIQNGTRRAAGEKVFGQLQGWSQHGSSERQTNKELGEEGEEEEDGGDWLHRALLRTNTAPATSKSLCTSVCPFEPGSASSALSAGYSSSSVSGSSRGACRRLGRYGDGSAGEKWEEAEEAAGVVDGWVSYVLQVMKHESNVSVDKLRVTPQQVKTLSEGLQYNAGVLQRLFSQAVQRLLTAINNGTVGDRNSDEDSIGDADTDHGDQYADFSGSDGNVDDGTSGYNADANTNEQRSIYSPVCGPSVLVHCLAESGDDNTSFIEEEEELMRSVSMPLPALEPVEVSKTTVDLNASVPARTAEVLSFGWREGSGLGEGLTRATDVDLEGELDASASSPIDRSRGGLNMSLVSEVAEDLDDENLDMGLGLSRVQDDGLPAEVELELNLDQSVMDQSIQEEEEDESYFNESFEDVC